MTRARRRRASTRAERRSQRAGPTRLQLPNGLRVVLCPRPHLSHAYAAVFFGVGSRHEVPDNNGITHVLEHMLFRGTARYRDATALNAAAEDFGGFLEGATYRDHLTFATGCHPSAVGAAVRILADLVQTPRYRAIEIERAILREELLETLDSAGRMIDLDNLSHQAVYGPRGLGLPIEGTLENLEAIAQPQLEAYRRRCLVGGNAVVSVAGPIDVDKVSRQIRLGFGSLPDTPPPAPEPAAPPKARPVLQYTRDTSSQVDIRVTFPGVSIRHPQYPSLVMLGRILADGLASRMHAELVDRRGLAYALHAGLTTYSDCALFDFEVAVAPNRAAEVVREILHFARKASRFRIGRAELGRARRRYRYGIEFMDDSPADLASWYGRAALFGVEEELEALSNRITRVSESQLRKAARDTFTPRGLVVTAVGELARGEWNRVRNVVAEWEH